MVGLRRRSWAVIKVIASAVASLTLLAVDYYHQYSLRIRAGERAVARTRRIRFSQEVRRRVNSRQNNRCMYCGIVLNRNNLEIDHIYPVEFGGPNEEHNYQALCKRCNSRKGLQIDSDFRHRYRELLGSVPVGRPPTTRIPYRRFDEITRRTRQGATTRSLRQSVYRTPRQKIIAGSTIAGAVLGGVWFFAILLTFPPIPLAGNVAVIGGLVIFGVVWVGSVWRAKVTGIWDLD